METELKFAVLIDADNISDKYIKIILEETANTGVATYKRIYGDWTYPQLASWNSVLLVNSLIPMQQYSYTSGKNATDCAMIIDAMDILYSGTVDGFCIASSDSDFTRLVARLRESGMQVIGMGEQKTPKPFISACNQFKYLDLLYSNQKNKAVTEKTPVREVKAAVKYKIKNQKTQTAAPPQEEIQPQSDLDMIKQTIAAIVEKFSDEDGWIFSGKLGDQLSNVFPTLMSVTLDTPN